VTILMEWARAPQLDTSSERLARLIATPPPALPRPLRVVRAEVAQETGRPVVRLWTGEQPPAAQRAR